MGQVYVKSIREMNQQNRIFYNLVKGIQSSILHKLAQLNEQKTKELAEDVKFTGQMLSMIDTKPLGKLKVQVISAADYAYNIDYGVPPESGTFRGFKGNYISFSDAPKLESWVSQKLMDFDQKLANFFLTIQAVKVGEHPSGYPYGYPNGVRSMEKGFEYAVVNSKMVVAEELAKLSV